MDGLNIPGMVVNLLGTTLIYIGVPLLIFKRKAKTNPFTKKRLRRLVIINAAVFSLIFSFAGYMLIENYMISFVPAVFWSTIAYFVLAGKTVEDSSSHNVVNDEDNIPLPISTPTGDNEIEASSDEIETSMVDIDTNSKRAVMQYCKFCGNKVDTDSRYCSSCGKMIVDKKEKTIAEKKTSRSKVKTIAIVALAIVAVVAIAGDVYFASCYGAALNKYEDLNKRFINMRDDYHEYTSNYAKEKSEFMDDHIVIVGDDGTNLYHKYGCPDLDDSTFWAYNSENAKAQGYKPCKKCN